MTTPIMQVTPFAELAAPTLKTAYMRFLRVLDVIAEAKMRNAVLSGGCAGSANFFCYLPSWPRWPAESSPLKPHSGSCLSSVSQADHASSTNTQETVMDKCSPPSSRPSKSSPFLATRHEEPVRRLQRPGW